MRPNSAGQFAKFCGSQRQNLSNSMAHPPIHLRAKWAISCQKNVSYWGLALCSIMLATFKENCQSFKVKVQSVKSNCVYLWLCHTAMSISRAHSFKLFTLIFSVTLCLAFVLPHFWGSEVANMDTTNLQLLLSTAHWTHSATGLPVHCLISSVPWYN